MQCVPSRTYCCVSCAPEDRSPTSAFPTRCRGNRFHLRSRSIWRSARETRCPIHRPALPERYCSPRSSPIVPEPWLQTFRLSNSGRKIPASACCDSGLGTACGPCTPRSADRESRNPMTQHVRDNQDKAVRSQASVAWDRIAWDIYLGRLLEGSTSMVECSKGFLHCRW